MRLSSATGSATGTGLLLLTALTKRYPTTRCADTTAVAFAMQPASFAPYILLGSFGVRCGHRLDAASSMSRTIRHDTSASSTLSKSDDIIPRAAVSVVARCKYANQIRYALVKRGKSPNKGIWSFPGGKIEPGESTLAAARRELWEETRLGTTPTSANCILEEMEQTEVVDAVVRWHTEGPITSSDSIHVGSEGVVQWHYVISQYFAQVDVSAGENEAPKMIASDDAADAGWWNAKEIEKGIEEGKVTPGVLRVIKRAEAMQAAGLLDCI